MSGRGRLFKVTVAALVLGLALMLPFEFWWTRTLGVIALATFVVCGMRLIASPGFLAADEPGEPEGR